LIFNLNHRYPKLFGIIWKLFEILIYVLSRNTFANLRKITFQLAIICSRFVDEASMVIKTCWVFRGSYKVRVRNFLKERVVRGNEYSRVECAPWKGCGANEKYIMTLVRSRPGIPSLWRRTADERSGRRREMVDEEGVKCDNLRGRAAVVADGKPSAI